MTEIVRITDVSPRDGLQNEPGIVPAADKVRLIQMLARTGVDEIEATSFVSPKWVPQLGDAEEVLSALRKLPRDERECVMSALVPNEKGFERAKQFHTAGFPLKISVFTAASETFNTKNTNATIGESIERFRAFLPEALALGMSVRLYVSTVIACPFEGPIAPAQVRRVCDQLADLAPTELFERGDVELDLGDTIGAATPESMRALLSEFSESERARLVIHLHDTFGRAADCVKVALDMGVRSFDGSVAGLGGCPYAGTMEKPAPGNISTELLVRTIQQWGGSTRVNAAALEEAAAFARTIVARSRAATV